MRKQPTGKRVHGRDGSFTVSGKAPNGEGSLYREPDGGWRATYRVPGESRPRRVRARTREEAVRRRAEALTKALVDETRSPTTSMVRASSTFAAADTRATVTTAPAATPTREPPRTKRGERTRQRLITAARAVFEREGYADARLSDITTEAGTAAGSFYTYFTDKEAVLAAVLEEVKEEMLHPHVEQVGHADTPAAVIEASNRAYLTSYQHNAKLMRLLDEVANVDDQFHKLRQRRSTAFVRRNARSIRDLQDRGLADPALDPLLGSSALSTMVARMAYLTFVAGDPWDFEDLVATLTRLWVNALRIPTD